MKYNAIKHALDTKVNHPDIQAAKNWFSSLPAGRRNYFKAHYRLNRDDKIVRFWINNIKEVS